MITFKKFFDLIQEGGAAGHMFHPFDLPDVKNGRDLINKFEDVPNLLAQHPGTLKIDGTNVSVKLITDGSNKQFALDRGSMSELDVTGITIDKLQDRFKPQDGRPHGMVKSGTIILSIFNKALPTITKEVKELGLWDDETKFINAEFVQGTTNVVEYDKDFLALHGINQFLEKYNRQGELVRPGAEREVIVNPSTRTEELQKGTSKPIPFNQQALDALVETIKPIGQEYGFDIISNIPVSKKIDLNLEPALNQTIEITISPNEVQRKTLEQFLEEHDNPKQQTILTVDGKKIGAVSKQNYLNVFSGTPLIEFYDNDPVNIKNVIAGALMYKATIDLGREVLRSYTSEYGDADSHEGIVIPTTPPFKITGDFIIQGMQSQFR